MEADSFAESGGGSGSGNRQRRRRDRDRYPGNNGSSQSVDEWQSHSQTDFGSYQGRRGAGIGARAGFGSKHADFRGDFVNGVYRPDNGTYQPEFVNGVYRPEGRYWPDDGGYGRLVSNGHNYDVYDSGQRGRGEGRRNRGRGYGGKQSYHNYAPPPPPQRPDQEEHNLKDLLLQVAPQARIVENTSRLSSKASANILSRVLNEAANTSATADMNGKYDQGNDAVSSALDLGDMAPNTAEDDDESAFMERWSGLFSRGSPLVEGSLEDPFQDVKKRTKVVWKKSSDRKGHRTRNQLRKQLKEQATTGENGEEENDLEQFDEEAGASVVYDASRPQWQPQRPPAHEEVMFQ